MKSYDQLAADTLYRHPAAADCFLEAPCYEREDGITDHGQARPTGPAPGTQRGAGEGNQKLSPPEPVRRSEAGEFEDRGDSLEANARNDQREEQQ